MMRLNRLCSGLVSLMLIACFPLVGQAGDRAAWMARARWGVMTHYLADWKAREMKEPMTVEKWNEMVDHFDVEGLAEQLQSVGAGYYTITIVRTPATIWLPTRRMIVSSASSRANAPAGILWRICTRPCTSGASGSWCICLRGCPPETRWPEKPCNGRTARTPIASSSSNGSRSSASGPRAPGAEGRRLVVRRMLLAQHDVSRRRGPEFRELRRGRPCGQP